MKKFFLFTIFIFSSLLATASPVLKSSVNKNQINLGETVTLSIEASDLNIRNFLFEFENSDYSTIAKSSSTSIEIVNGARTQKESIELILKPKHIGDIVIPSLKIQEAGINHSTEEIRITVLKTDAKDLVMSPNKNKFDQDSQRSQVFIKANLNKQKAYLNEQVLLKLKIYHKGNLRSFRGEDFQFEGFIHKKNDEVQEYTEFINGEEFLVYEISYILFPIKTGVLSIPANEMEARITSRRGNYDPWDAFNRFSGLFLYEEALILKTEPLELNVETVPNAPKFFGGYVGELSLAHKLDKSEIEEGDAVSLNTKIYGNGNPKVLDLNLIEESKQYKIYKDKEEISNQINNLTEYFEINSRHAIIPNGNRGQLLIRTNPIVNFNPKTKKFEEHGSQEFYLSIKPRNPATTSNEIKELPENEESNDSSRNFEEEKASIILNFSKSQIESYKEKIPSLSKLWILVSLINFLVLINHTVRSLLKSNASRGFTHSKNRQISELIKSIKKTDSLEDLSKNFRELIGLLNPPPDDLKNIIDEFLNESDKVNYGLKALEDLETFREKALLIIKELKK
jgi:hypothetical protein